MPENSLEPNRRRRTQHRLCVAHLLLAAVCVATCTDGSKPVGPPSAQVAVSIEVSPGVVGSPAKGDRTLAVGDRVTYSYAASPGFSGLSVWLNGKSVATSGSFRVDSAFVLVAAADSVVERTQAEIKLSDAFRSLLDGASLSVPLGDLSELTGRLYASEGPRAARIQVARAWAEAFDPLVDASRLRDAQRRIGDSLYLALSDTTEPAARSDSDRASAIGSAAATSFIYVNGIHTTLAEWFETQRNFVEPAIRDAGYSDPHRFRYPLFHNQAASESDERNQRLLGCVGNAIIAARGGGYATLARSSLCTALFAATSDLGQAVGQALNDAILNVDPALMTRDGELLASKIRTALANGGRVVLIGHSQGNMMVNEALALIQKPGQPSVDMGCVATIAIAPPLAISSAPTSAFSSSMILEFGAVKDVLLMTPALGRSATRIENALARELNDAFLASSRWENLTQLPIFNTLLHSINESYLAPGSETHTMFKEYVRSAVSATEEHCGAAAATMATIRVTSNVASSWSISPSGSSGVGTTASHSVEPSTTGTWFTVTPASIQDLKVTVAEGGAESKSIFVRPGEDRSVTLTYSSGAPASPTIVGITPDNVSASATPQLLTVQGSGFHANATVTLRNLRTGQVLEAVEVIRSTPTEMDVRVALGIETAGWTVRVNNPGGVSSQEFPFQVASGNAGGFPDLIVRDLSVTPNVVQPGQALTVAFLIRNNGGGAAGATRTRVQLKSTAGIVVAELAFASVPLLASAEVNESRALSIPSTTQIGSYAAYVSVDADNQVVQSSTANDLASAPFNVGGPTPATPTSLTPGTAGAPGPTTSGSSVTLAWSAVAGATTYSVAVRELQTDVLVIDRTGVTGTTLLVALTPGSRYRWNVSACSGANCSSFATRMYFQTPGDAAVPATPADRSPGTVSAPGPVLQGSTAILSWGVVAGATSYGVAMRDLLTDALIVDVSGLTGSTYTVTLAAGRQYRWNVAACNATGCSAFAAPSYFQSASIGSTQAPATPGGRSPGASASPGPTVPGNNLVLSWGGVAGATSYSLAVRDLQSNALVVDLAGIAGTAQTVQLTSARPHRWNVAACNAAGCSQYSEPMYLQTAAVTTVPASPSDLSPGTTSSPGPTLSGTSVTLGWGGVSGASNYSLAVRDLSTDELVVDLTGLTGASRTVTLVAGHPYRWNVAACNSAGCSSFTAPHYFQVQGAVAVPVTPSGGAPGTIASPGPTVSNSTVALSWGAVNGATNYGLAVRDLQTNALVVDLSGLTGTTHSVTLTPGHPYRWNVSACNSAGCSTFSTPLHFQTQASVTIPAAPDNLTPGTAGSPGPILSGTGVTLSWGVVTGATTYSVAVRDLQTNTIIVDVAGVAGTSHAVSLLAGRPYRWNVAACNTAGCSSFASPVHFQTQGVVTVPAAPVNLTPGTAGSPGPSLSGTNVTLTWGSVAGATTYSVALRDMQTNVLVVDANGISGTAYAVSLLAGRPYRWNVAACSSAGCSSFSSPIYFQTQGVVTVPATPGNLTPGSGNSPGPTISGNSVTLSWGFVAGATSYSVAVRDLQTNLLIVDVSGLTGTAHGVSLTSGHQYRWNVAACNSAGCSSFSSPMYFQSEALVSVPATPGGLSPGASASPGPTISNASPTLSWGAVSGATSYSIAVRDLQSNVLVVDLTGVTGASRSLSLTAGRPYRWNVAACNSAGCSSYSAPVYFRTP